AETAARTRASRSDCSVSAIRGHSRGHMDVAITGSTGLIGTALSSSLRSDGHRVRPIVRRSPSGPDELPMDNLDLSDVDAVVHLAGEGIAEKRWDDEQKRKIWDSRRDGTRAVADAVARSDRTTVLLSGSAVGYYGSRGDEILTEDAPAGEGFLADLCIEWEASTGAATGARVVHVRTGIVLTPRGGALSKLLPLFKLGLGGRMGSGKQWMSWITLEDEVRAITHLLTADVAGPVNLTAPNPVTNAELGKTLGRVLHRPSVLPTPAFGPRLLLGRELASSLLFDSQRVLPARLVVSGFAHEHPQLEGALRDMLNR
ncbi:MAG: uncharacterized protein QOI47_244, partial [Actinomycetota bacterium]|nr:uncharacterized protein [Actinomycetota bacterium]